MGTFQADAVYHLTKVDDTPTSQTKSRAEALQVLVPKNKSN